MKPADQVSYKVCDVDFKLGLFVCAIALIFNVRS
jgi:hypothetical protein